MAPYSYSIESLRKMIKERYPLSETKEYDLATLNLTRIMFDENLRLMLSEHISWMFDKIEKMEYSEKGKAGRWFGWCVGYMEIMGFLTNAQTRDIVRVDVGNGNA